MLPHLQTACSVLHYVIVYLCARFDLSELQLQCEQYTENPAENPREQKWDACPAHEPAAEPQQSLADTQFLELLRSMWEHEDGDGEEVGEAKNETVGEDEKGSRDGEIKEDIVNEDELNEIYEFAATQRRMGAEADVSTDSGDEGEEGMNNCSDAKERDEGKQNAKMEEAADMHRSAGDDLNSGSNKNMCQSRGPDASLDRSYNRMFSEAWGEYMEPPQTQTRNLIRMDTPTSRRTSSVSEVIDLSISPPPDSEEPVRSLFPVTGMSPGEVPSERLDQSEAVHQALTSESPNARGVSQLAEERSKLCSKDTSTSALSKTQGKVTPSLPSSTKPKLSPPTPSRSQPELIVLSDSSDDMEQDLPDEVPSCGDAHRPPTASPSRLSLRYAHFKETTQVRLSPKKSNKTPNSVHSEPSRSEQVGSESIMDGSGEISWLIPATPEPSTRTSSTQTSSCMRRTQLFPRSHTSSSSFFSSSISDNPKTASCSSSLKEPHREPLQPSPTFQKLISNCRLSKTSHRDSVSGIYPNSGTEPCSSTPLHSDPRLQRLDPLGSPLLRDSELRTQRRAGQEDRLGSLHLSPSVNSSPQQTFQSEKESSKSPAKSQHCDSLGDSGDQEISTEDKEAEETRTSKSNESNEVIEEEFTFVFDEPPIAFDDSWGLGGAVAEQGPCFSLRLESSGDQMGPPEQSGQGETASTHTLYPPGHGAQHNLPDPGAPHNHSLPDAAMWDSWKEGDEDEEEVDALPLSQRVGPVALSERVAQLRTPGSKVSMWSVMTH